MGDGSEKAKLNVSRQRTHWPHYRKKKTSENENKNKNKIKIKRARMH